MLRLGSISRNSRTTRSHNKHSNAQCVMGHSSTQSKTCKTTTLQSTLLLMRLELTRIQRKIQTDKQSHQTRHGTKQNRISHSLISAPQPHLLQHSRPHRFAIQHLLCSKRSVCFPVNTLCPKPISFFELCSVVPAVLDSRRRSLLRPGWCARASRASRATGTCLGTKSAASKNTDPS